MEITYMLTAADYYESLKAYRSRRFVGRWFWRLIWVVIALALVVPLVYLLIGNHNMYLQFRPWFIVGILWAILFGLGPRYTARRYAKGIPGAAHPRTMTITDDGIHTRNAQNESRLAWPSLLDWREGKNVFTVFMSPISFFPVPKRAMTDARQQEFRALLKQHVQPS